MLSSTQRNYHDHSLHKHMSLGSHKRAFYFDPMRYHGTFIKNVYYYQLPLTMTHRKYIINLRSHQ